MKSPNWYVITGGPCSGKTTLVNYLAHMGYHTLPETARLIIDIGVSKGKSVEQVRANVTKFQNEIFKLKFLAEQNTPKNRIVFMDRGLPDTWAYYKFLKLNMKMFYKHTFTKKYKKVFLLQMLPFIKDYARIEDKKTANIIHDTIKQAYRYFNYDIVEVPVMKTVEKRAKFVIKHIIK